MSLSVMVALLAPRRFNEGMVGFLAGLHFKEGSMKVCILQEGHGGSIRVMEDSVVEDPLLPIIPHGVILSVLEGSRESM